MSVSFSRVSLATRGRALSWGRIRLPKFMKAGLFFAKKYALLQVSDHQTVTNKVCRAICQL